MKESLLLDLYELTMGQSYFVYKRNTLATFDLYVRALPERRAYLIACGLNDILDYIKNLRFSEKDLKFLRGLELFSEEFIGYLRGFSFHGDIWAMPEGTVFFANEPILRVTAPIIEGQIIESFLLNTINLQTMIASKAARVALAAGKRGVFDFSLRRTHGSDAGLKAARSSYIAGCRGTSNVLASKLFGIPVSGTMAHSFIMSFRDELDSFTAYSSVFPDKTTLLVDTYNTAQGIRNAVRVGLALKGMGHKLQAIRLDSGDIASLSRSARRLLDAAGLKDVKIFASGNLDEFKIRGLLSKGARIDHFGVGTNMGTSIDAPSLDVVYKISEVREDNGFLPTMKLSSGKVTYPGRKQVFRVKDRRGRFLKDVLGLEGEKIKGSRLLVKAVNKGRVVYKSPPLDKIREFTGKGLAMLPEKYKDIDSKSAYPVVISPRLEKLRKDVSGQLKKRQ